MSKALNPQKLFIEKLASSGLTLEDAKKLKMHVTEVEDVGSPGAKRIALKIPYYDPNGNRLTFYNDFTKQPEPFWRARYLAPGATSFGSLSEKSQSLRYIQPPHTSAYAYFPQNYKWAPLLEKPVIERLFITEGELKAAKACQMGYPCIGLGGVYNWKSMKHGITFLPELESVNWKHCLIYLVFDSDTATNLDVATALYQLSRALTVRGACPQIVSLPTLPDKSLPKVGLDDYFLHRTKEDFEQLIENATGDVLSTKLWEMNTKVALLDDTDTIIVQSPNSEGTYKIMTPHQFEHVAFSDQWLDIAIPDKRSVGKLRIERKSIPKEWINWPHRYKLENVAFEPGQPKVIGGTRLNLWPGWPIEPAKKADPEKIRLFIECFKMITVALTPEERTWFLQWLAYPIQHPGTKMFTAVILFSITQGTGKTLLANIISSLYGEGAQTLSSGEIAGSFNEWAKMRQFIFADEIISRSDRLDNADKLKNLITGKRVTVNEKFKNTYKIRDCINWMFATNHQDAFVFENTDRRYFVVEIPWSDTQIREKWLSLMKQVAGIFLIDPTKPGSGHGLPDLMRWLLDVNLDSFDPADHAPETRAKRKIRDNSKPELDLWCDQLRLMPEEVLCVGRAKATYDMYSASDLLMFYDGDRSKHATAAAMSKALGRAGFVMANQGEPIHIHGTLKQRLWIVRNADRWQTAASAAIAKHKLNGGVS